MQRTTLTGNRPTKYFSPGVSDEEALLVQLCEHLFRTGFLFDDAKLGEIEAGERVLQDFFDQEGEMVESFLKDGRVDKFLRYVQEHSWNRQIRQQKVRGKLLKAFDQLAHGAHHSFNIQRNIHVGLMNVYGHVLQDFLLYIAAYHALFLDETEPEMPQNFTMEDILNMRQNLVEKLEGRKFVDFLLHDIAKHRGGELPRSVKSVRNLDGYQPIEFVRPSQQSFATPSRSPQTSIHSQTSTQVTSSDPLKEPAYQEQTENTPRTKQSATPVVDEEEFIDDLDFEEEGSAGDVDSSVVYGEGPISKTACMEFVQEHPDSAFKFLFRRDITEKPLSDDMMQIYESWEQRGLRRGYVRKLILEIMGWENLPSDQTILEMTHDLKDRIYELTH